MVLLRDGRALLTGGSAEGGRGAQLFDPRTQRWTALSPMNQSRYSHTMSVLKDGRVLVAGGISFEGSLAPTDTAEIWDPAGNQRSGAFIPVAPMKQSRYAHSATVLSSGLVLVVGGQTSGHGDLIPSAELFNPNKNLWIDAGRLGQGRAEHTATSLPDGTVLVVGGRGPAHNLSLRDASIFHPLTNSWTPVPELLPEPRGLHSATLMKNGKVLIAGGTKRFTGFEKKSLLRTTLIYDPAAGSFKTGPPMRKGRMYHAGVLLPDGRVLEIGGSGASKSGSPRADAPLDTAEVYDSGRKEWSELPRSPSAFGLADSPSRTSAVVLASDCGKVCGRVLTVGPGPTAPTVEILGTGPGARGGAARTTQRSNSPGAFGLRIGLLTAVVAALLLVASLMKRTVQKGHTS